MVIGEERVDKRRHLEGAAIEGFEVRVREVLVVVQDGDLNWDSHYEDLVCSIELLPRSENTTVGCQFRLC